MHQAQTKKSRYKGVTETIMKLDILNGKGTYLRVVMLTKISYIYKQTDDKINVINNLKSL